MGIGNHQSATCLTDEWLTPPEIISALGEFDLDPCSPVVRPWPTAKNHLTILDNSLQVPWHGRVWLNPPYGRKMGAFLQIMTSHHNGIALIFARTETQDFHKHVWPFADTMLFLEGRLTFYDIHGNLARTKKGAIANCGAPSVLISYGEQNADSLADSGIKGRHIPVNSVPMIIVGVSPEWRSVIRISITRLNGNASVQEIYAKVELIAPDKIIRNRHYREKIRQVLAKHFARTQKGYYSIKKPDEKPNT